MPQICFTIAGVRHCIDIPLLVDFKHVKPPPPNNFPELDLALTVLELVKIVKPSDLAKQFTETATAFVTQVQAQLPKGVEISANHRER